MSTITTEDSIGISFSERLPLAFTHGLGSRVWDEAGKSYLDFTSGWGVTCLGHAHPVIVAAISRQAGRLLQSPNAGFTYSPERAALLRLLQPLLPDGLAHLYFCSSGAEANDAALKLARKITGRSKVVSTRGGFHGRSFNTLSVSRGPDNSERYLPVLDGITFVTHGDTHALAAALDEQTAALIIEPVQGEGGVRIPPANYLAEARQLCDRVGALLIIDEVQTGFGRTGKLFAVQHSEVPVRPDIMTLAKGIAGGFPFAAFAVTPQVRSALSRDDHGGTYSGSPLGCAVAHAVVSHLVEHDVPAQAARKGNLLCSALHDMAQRHEALVQDVRGLGLLCAMELREASLARELTLQCAELGLLVVPTRGGIVRLLPDLLISANDLQSGIALLDAALDAVAVARR